MRFRTAYEEVPPEGYVRPTVQWAPDAQGAIQNQRDQVDVNVLMKRYGAAGAIPTANAVQLVGEFDMAMDLQSAIEKVERARDLFSSLPAEVRRVSENSAVRMIELASTPEGLEVLREAGLEMREKPQAAPASLPEVSPPAPETPVAEPPGA